MALSEDYWGLRGKKVLITGASKGLGQVLAEAFAEEGADLLLTGRSGERLEALVAACAGAERHAFFVADLRQSEEIGALAAEALAFGPIDVILHVAGGGLGMSQPRSSGTSSMP